MRPKKISENVTLDCYVIHEAADFYNVTINGVNNLVLKKHVIHIDFNLLGEGHITMPRALAQHHGFIDG